MGFSFKRSDRMWSTGEGNGKPLQYSCHLFLISKGLEWVNLTQMTIISTTAGKNPLEKKRNSHHSQQNSPKCSTWMQSQKRQNDLCLFPRQTIQYHSLYAPTSTAEEAEVAWFYEDLQDLLEITPHKYVLLITGDWNAKVGSQETPGVTGEFGLGMRNEAGQRLIEFCQENALVIANTLFQ